MRCRDEVVLDHASGELFLAPPQKTDLGEHPVGNHSSLDSDLAVASNEDPEILPYRMSPVPIDPIDEASSDAQADFEIHEEETDVDGEAISPVQLAEIVNQSGYDNLDIATIFDDDDSEYNPLLTTAVVNTPESEASASLNTTQTSPLHLGLNVPVATIVDIGNEYHRFWYQGIKYRICLPGADESKTLRMAVDNVRHR